MIDAENNVISYTYDAAKRLKTVKLNGNTEATYDYNALGLRTFLTYGNGSYTEYEYDPTYFRQWLTALYNKQSGGTVISSFVYTYDNVGNRSTMTLANGDMVTYDYDNIYQLESEIRTGNVITYTIGWTYDKAGNRLTQTRDGLTTTYTHNDANQMTVESISGVLTPTDYAYDPNGNLITKTRGALTWISGYDYENRMTGYIDNELSVASTYTYDAFAKRVGKNVGGVAEIYLLDGANVVADYNITGTVLASYVTPFLDDNLVISRGSATYYYLHDGLGSVRNIIDNSQSISNTYDYVAFGEVITQTETLINRYKFTSREWDGESQTYNYRARQYNPINGRFSRRDLIGYLAGLNLYSYAKSNPVRYSDPFGLLAREYCEKGCKWVKNPNADPKACETNGCSVPWFLAWLWNKDAPAGVSFRDACDQHDLDYCKCGGKQEKYTGKQYADNRLLSNMNYACANALYPPGDTGNILKLACYAAANSYYWAVSNYGDSSFKKRQDENCYCECPSASQSNPALPPPPEPSQPIGPPTIEPWCSPSISAGGTERTPITPIRPPAPLPPPPPPPMFEAPHNGHCQQFGSFGHDDNFMWVHD